MGQSKVTEIPPAGSARHELVVVANRLPVQRSIDEHDWTTSPGGLVRALLSVLRARDGAWIGWGGEVDGDDRAELDHDGVHLVPVALSADEHAGYYEGVANGALWPLYHDAIRPSTFEAGSWTTYREVNERFARAVAEQAAPGGVVWVHDYHLQLVPQMLRELRPDVTIGFFLHIPFPPQELFMRLPWREEILHGLLGADLIGFQRKVAAENFVSVAKRLVGATGQVPLLHLDDGRTVRVGAFPISIDVDEFDEIARRPETSAAADDIRERLGRPDAILVGVDRLDYTKGIDGRLLAVREVLRRRSAAPPRSVPQRIVMVQVAVPSREGLGDYLEERHRVEQLVGEINGDYSTLGYPAVHYLHQSLPLDELVALYQVADVMLVTPLRDGMNLVAKEFAAARIDEQGVLVLSEFAGAADELVDAIIVNPHDLEAMVEAIETAIDLDPAERRQHMVSIRKAVESSDVHTWADTMLRLLER